jgi:GT2 family glycosyltransferase/glycosyltransferase involved in cell wall biosynthesis
MLQIINYFTKRFNMQKQLIIFSFPLPPTELVREVVTGLPAREFVVNGPGVTSTYLSECGLDSARIIDGGMDLQSRISLILSLRTEDLEDVIYIGYSSDLVSLTTSILSGSRQPPIIYQVSQELSSRRIYLIPLLARLIWRLTLFLLTIPVLLFQRVLFSGSRKELKAEKLVSSAPVAGEILPPVSIVIPNFNGRKLLAECLPSILRALDEYPSGGEIILVDDASSDGSAQWAKKNFSSVRVIALDKNQGFGRAANLGISSACNRTVVLLNSDIIVESGFLHPLVEHLRDPELFAVQPRLNTWSGDRLDLGVSIGHMENGYIRIWNEKETGHPKYLDFTAPNLYAVGGAMVFDREKWDILGGFDEIYYPFCWEDIDISYRAWKRGWKVLYEPGSEVNHLHYGTISRFFTPEYKRVIEHRNEFLFIWKNIHSPRLWRSHLHSLPRLLLSALLTGNYAFYKAFWQTVPALGTVMKKRRQAAALVRIGDEEVFRRSLLPYQNWVKGGFKRRKEGAKPRILMITSVVPYPPNDGGKIRIYQMLKKLASRYDIHFLCFYRDQDDLEQLKEIQEFCRSADAVPFSSHPMALPSRALFPEFCQNWISPEMSGKILDIVRTLPIDLVQIDFTMMAYYGRLITDIPVIFVELDAGILQFGKSYNPAGRGWRKLLEFYEWLRMLRFELARLPEYTKVIVLNIEDEKLLKSFLPDLDISTVTMGTDLDHFLEDFQPVENNRMLYVGSLTHHPNVDAIRWFVLKVLPLIRETIPGALVSIVGSGDPSGIDDIRDLPGVEYIGQVEDVRPYLRRAAVFVAPVRLGSGMKGKVLEALAMAKPMVAASVAASGIPVVSGQHLIIADDPRSFSEGVIKLFRDPDLREKIALNGQQLIKKQFSWKRKADEMDMIYREILGRT